MLMEESQSWKLDDEYSSTAEQYDTSDLEPVTWTASEFVHHDKPKSWYIKLVFGGIFLAIAVFLLSYPLGKVSALFSSVVTILAVVALAMTGSRKPRTMQYVVNDEGIRVGDKLYDYENFKTFSLIDGPVGSLVLMPIKKIAAPLTIYFALEDAENIVRTLGAYLPHEQRPTDMVDKLMNRIRF
jgi:hypothetical protein